VNSGPTQSLAGRPLHGAAEARLHDWLRAVAAGDTAPLGALDAATADVLRRTRLDALARARGADHSTLRDVERRQFAQVTLAAAATARTVEMLAGAGVPSSVLKGLPLAQRYWGDAFARPSVDVDLLVTKSDYQRARSALLTGGFAVREEWVPAWYLTRWFYHETFEGSGPLAIAVELHWDVVRPGLGDADVAGLLAANEPVTVAGRQLPAPGPAWQLFVVALHAVHEFFGARHLLDVALVARALDAAAWETAVELAAAARLGPSLWYGVHASSEWLDWSPPAVLDRLRPSAARDRVARGYILRLPPFAVPSRLDLQLQHVVAPTLSSDGLRAVTRIPYALLTDRGYLAMRVERARRRFLRGGRAAGARPPAGRP
jgi:hypothetical protein